ncbi:glycosyltransferase family 4 protein [Clostridium perfringens]|nr:glycosyltransferase family 4 protein [Clostridium perfringens]EHA1009142.1 glycosyltransferase family 4 protein [Clostridium perfringens]EHA1021453.1 glycosyltransferase family 4 protein [Clostridium perfringens]MDU6313873.1 glycosyltransferase [Clostridium perfringens]
MRILHYSLGLPPYRSGGMTKYVNDIALEQSNYDDVNILFPGVVKAINKEVKIKYNCNLNGVKVYEIINPLPVSLLNGIKNIDRYIENKDEKVFLEYLKKMKFDIVNIHTFMGLPKEFLQACKKMDIKIVYTTHDYFGICPKVNLLDFENNICSNYNFKKCIKCNVNGNSYKKNLVLQSKLYRFLKSIKFLDSKKDCIKFLKKRSKKFKEKNIKETKEDYEILFKYYKEMFLLIDKFIFNSSVTKSVFRKFLDVDGEIINLTHKSISDNRKRKEYLNKELKISFLGGDKKYKGYDLIINIMKSLNKKGINNIYLNIYGTNKKSKELNSLNIKFNGFYNYSMLNEIFSNTDLLIVPSLCFETYGFVTLEALSYGVPVLITETVGSKDILNNKELKKGIICNYNDIENNIINIYKNRNILKEFNRNILSDSFDFDITTHCKILKEAYINVLKI